MSPSILLIPGAFGLPEFYNPVTDAVSLAGYRITSLHLPSAGAGPEANASSPPLMTHAPPSMYDDAAFIAAEISKRVDEGEDVMIIAHSYGGLPTTESVKGFGKEERQKQGKKGGVVRLAYISAIIAAVGTNAAEFMAAVPAENKIDMTIDEYGWMVNDHTVEAAAISFSDLPPSEGETWIRKMPRQSAVSFGGNLTYAGYEHIPVSYLLCERDRCIPPANQRAGIELIEKVSGRKVDLTSIEADHCPMVAEEKKVIDWILDVVKKTE